MCIHHPHLGLPMVQRRDVFVPLRVGFAINLDTARKLRQSLFLRRVLESPHVNQADYLAGQRRSGTKDETTRREQPQCIPDAIACTCPVMSSDCRSLFRCHPLTTGRHQCVYLRQAELEQQNSHTRPLKLLVGQILLGTWDKLLRPSLGKLMVSLNGTWGQSHLTARLQLVINHRF